MDIIENKTVDALTTDSVSILTRKYVEIDGIPTQVGENHRRAYENSEKGRIQRQYSYHAGPENSGGQRGGRLLPCGRRDQ